ncbi:MAG TPA: hypothetical protein PK379_06725 [Candidatus Hydrogenedentes bacterium]|nr:hypothetical protein [Candidatus Hydrogenedentota bacterium]HOK89703.1 hypothetical protein [Candidatus Hydrogenedentota bacterium]
MTGGMTVAAPPAFPRRAVSWADGWAVCCFTAAAAALPGGSLQQVTPAGLDLAAFLAMAGGILVLPGVIADRIRVPFELVWPVMVLSGMAYFRAWVGGAEEVSFPAVLSAAVGFLGAAHVTRHGSVSRAGLAAWALFAPVPVLLTAAAGQGWLFPENWSRAGQPMLGAPDPVSLTGMLLLCGVAGGILSAETLLPGKWIGGLWLVPFLAAGGLLVMMSQYLGWPVAEMIPRGEAFAPGRIPETLVWLYLASRVTAKMTVAARSRREPGLATGALACLLGTPVAVLWSPPSMVPLGVMVGMLVGPAISRGAATAMRFPRGWRLMVLVPMALVILRLGVVLPGDPRDYVARADQLVRKHQPEAAEFLLRQVNARVPGESRAAWQLAWLWLARDEPDHAARWAVRALRSAGSGVKPAFFSHPAPLEIQRFVDALRDAAGRNTASGDYRGTLALGRVLFAAGRDDQALALLDALTRDEPCPPSLPLDLARRLVAWLLEVPADALPESVSPDALWTALRAGAGTRIFPLPREIAGRCSAMALAARPMEDWTDILVIAGDTEIGGAGRWFVERRPPLPAGAFPDWADRQGTLNEEDTWSGPLPGETRETWFVYHPAGIAVSLVPPAIGFRAPLVHYRYNLSTVPDILLLLPDLPELGPVGNSATPREAS